MTRTMELGTTRRIDFDCVLFDFDIPLAHLFAGHPAPGIAHRLKGRLAATGHLPAEVARSTDPHQVMRVTARHHPHLAGELEAFITGEEIEAATSAEPTEGAIDLVEDLAAAGVLLAITTNNAAAAVRKCLRKHAINVFGDHVYGRLPDLELMKPNPDCLHRAMRGLGVPPKRRRRCLMVGDSPSDAIAAAAAGVEFLGYAPTREGAVRLRAAGATRVVTAMADVLQEMGADGMMAA